MKCPVCTDTNLLMTDRQGIEIDYCPGCRGVWLDRGELDKLIERSPIQADTPPPPPRQPAYDNRDSYSSSHDPRRGHDQHQGGYYKKKKKEGFLSDLFDF